MSKQQQDASASSSSGVIYTMELLRGGAVIDSETIHNIMPAQGRNHMVSVVMKGATPAPAWYIGLFEGNYVPVDADIAASFPTLATESTAYAPPTRASFTSGVVSAGAVDNTASRAEFTFTSAKTIYGAFMTSGQAKGAVTGTLLSAARFISPKAVQVDDVLRVTASLSVISA